MEVGDVDPLDDARRGRQPENLRQPREPLLRIDEEHLRLDMLLEVAALVERFEEPDLVAEPSRPLELEPPR